MPCSVSFLLISYNIISLSIYAAVVIIFFYARAFFTRYERDATQKEQSHRDDRERDASRVREVMSKKTFCVGCKLSSLSIVSNLDIKRSVCHQLE